MLLALIALGVLALLLALPWLGSLGRSLAKLTVGARGARPTPVRYDPGRERRAEQRARELLRSCVNDAEWAMYRDLGFIRVPGGTANDPGAPPSYAYLIYPHKPIVAYVPATGRLLSEYCVRFPDLSATGHRLPASDDVLAKWMALTSDEARLIAQANMHLVGRQLDPARIRRDLWRLTEWEHSRAAQLREGA